MGGKQDHLFSGIGVGQRSDQAGDEQSSTPEWRGDGGYRLNARRKWQLLGDGAGPFDRDASVVVGLGLGAVQAGLDLLKAPAEGMPRCGEGKRLDGPLSA
ncbi:hypothetical protein Ate02nite_15410 [Paractinoplanes tereljensis]|uniref:Uncharacterized protein n=1 Tax=Paractinoplanes tereljensis TaxID=571912 RepID=A0A919NHL4_9ACTN|nr:hypothetical protein Ate02nite_15410 [Actinoplanes tereljensis]